MPRPDDDALSWAGDEDDPTLVPGASGGAAEPVAAAGAPVDAAPRTGGERAPEPAAEQRADDGEPEARRLGDVALVTLGVLGGVYLLWTVGWVLGAMRLRDWIQVQTGAVADAMFHGSMVLAILAPAIWFAASWYLTRGRPAWLRIAALLVGVVVLVPWPFVMVGVIGQ
ncbi:DNA polymerase III subunit gamma/tau [Microbacterium sp. Marseille-Q6965]|uniref:DNA polymerase III subunit gamma/tau n=1 Tax=Microbacterium sp. Marseille-Q6965 TaxID=2965072 RepID=UPI0021B7B154|nr:DNA polymerase III subunit gamma/tau [Microbacterium sp. Marseille-Q6965]